jgi:putative ABC transport system permease protein
MKQTLRTLLRSRGFTAAVLVTLTLGIALETSVVAIVNAYLVRSLPYPNADRLYSVMYAPPDVDHPPGLADLDWQSVSDVVEHPIAWDLDVFYLRGGAHPERAPGAWVTPGFMQGLGIRAALGRSFTAGDFVTGAPQVALISHEMWQRRFGADSGILGRTFDAYVSDRPQDPERFTIVGVLPAGFWHLNPYTQVLTPLRATSYPYLVSLRDGVPVEMAEERIGALVRASNTALGATYRPELRSTHGEYLRQVKPMLLAIGASVTLVLLIACSNVALLMLLRGLRRQKEIAVRLALGAPAGRIARLLLGESLTLTTIAAVAGSLLAWLLVRALAGTIELQLGRRVPGGATAMTLDVTVLSAVVLLTLVIAAVVSLVVYAATRRHGIFATLRHGARGGTERPGGRRTRLGLVVAEVAGSLTLLVGCGLMVRTVLGMLHVDMGIRAEGVISANLAIRDQSYPDDASRATFYDRVLRSVSEMPGVASMALASPPPLAEYNPMSAYARDGRPEPTPAAVRIVSADYFATLDIPVRQGRPFTTVDQRTTEPVAIVSESVARRLWPNANAVGRQLRIMERGTLDTVITWRTIVGVVKDVRQSPTDQELTEVYLPLLQVAGRFASILIRTSRDAPTWLDEIRRTLGTIDPEATVGSMERLSQLVDAQMARPRFLASLFAGFGFFATLLGVMGLYGVVSYAVKQREQEVAVRMAVGADARAIVALFMREGAIVLLAGVAAGALGAVAIGRVLSAQLFGVASVDFLTLVLATLGLGVACLVATWWPARRATRSDPLMVLKAE